MKHNPSLTNEAEQIGGTSRFTRAAQTSNQDKAAAEWTSDSVFDVECNASLYRANNLGDGSIPKLRVATFPIVTDAALVARMLNEHAALVAVAEAAKILSATSGKSAAKDCLVEKLANLAAIRAGGEK